MPSKVEYEKTFNEMLGTEIKWSRLNLEDLIQLAVLFNNPDFLMKRIGVNIEKDERRRRIIDAGIETAKDIANKWNGPLARFFKNLVSMEERQKIIKAQETSKTL